MYPTKKSRWAILTLAGRKFAALLMVRPIESPEEEYLLEVRLEPGVGAHRTQVQAFEFTAEELQTWLDQNGVVL